MVLLSPSEREMMVDENAHIVLHAGELDACDRMKEDCVRMQQILAHFRGAHDSAGLVQRELQVVALYNETLQHLDAACDGMLAIMNKVSFIDLVLVLNP